jgi:hypothetical protein
MSDSDYWMLEGFDRATDALKEEHVLAGRSDRYWGDLFGRAADDPLLGEWEVTETERQRLEEHLGIALDVDTRVYFVGRRRDL